MKPTKGGFLFCGFTNEEVLAIEATAMRRDADCALDAWVIFHGKIRKAKKANAGKIWVLLLAKLKTEESRGEGVALAMKLFAKIARDLARDAYRRESKSVSFSESSTELSRYNPIHALENRIDAEFLMRALLRHSVAEYEAVKLVVLEDKPIKEAAKEMSCTIAAAKERKLRGIKYLHLYTDIAEKRNNLGNNGATEQATGGG